MWTTSESAGGTSGDFQLRARDKYEPQWRGSLEPHGASYPQVALPAAKFARSYDFYAERLIRLVADLDVDREWALRVALD